MTHDELNTHLRALGFVHSGINISQAAKALGVDRTALHNYLSGYSPVPHKIDLAIRGLQRKAK